jgi:hypothetical protein
MVMLSDIVAATGRLPKEWVDQTESVGTEGDVDLITQLAQKSASFLPSDEMDSWLAPRLHNALRISRRVATDDGLWTWLAFQCRDFIVARFGKGTHQVHPWRYRGVWSRNGISRLWWGAEMTRNGPDYTATRSCFARTRTAQFALELMYSWDRAAAIAFSTVAEGADGRKRLTDLETKRLSTRLKLYLSLRSLDAFGDKPEESEEFDAEWATHIATFGSLVTTDLGVIVGPSTGRAEAKRLLELTEWFRRIAEDLSLEDAA